jgi:iron complex outermembrane receptor protein
MRQHLVTWGAGMRVSPSGITQTVPTLDVTPHDQTDATYSLFAQDDLSFLGERLRLTAGAKLEHLPAVGLELQPSVRLLWTPTDRQSFWTSVTRAVRTGECCAFPGRLQSRTYLQGSLRRS